MPREPGSSQVMIEVVGFEKVCSAQRSSSGVTNSVADLRQCDVGLEARAETMNAQTADLQ